MAAKPTKKEQLVASLVDTMYLAAALINETPYQGTLASRIFRVTTTKEVGDAAVNEFVKTTRGACHAYEQLKDNNIIVVGPTIDSAKYIRAIHGHKGWNRAIAIVVVSANDYVPEAHLSAGYSLSDPHLSFLLSNKASNVD